MNPVFITKQDESGTFKIEVFTPEMNLPYWRYGKVVLENFSIEVEDDFFVIKGEDKEIYYLPYYDSEIDEKKLTYVDKRFNKIEKIEKRFLFWKYNKYNITNIKGNKVLYVVLNSVRDYTLKVHKSRVYFVGKEAKELLP